MQIGIIGLGRMGINMARRMLKEGHEVFAYNRSIDKTELISSEGAVGIYDINDFKMKMKKPRSVIVMLPAGEIANKNIFTLSEVLESGDIIIDGGNSNYEDDIKRKEYLSDKGIKFMDAGISGGVWGLENGYCLMIGGERTDYEYLKPVFLSLSSDNGNMYCGGTGAGHFVKMIHNGIEYAMMESYAEGFELLRASKYGENIDFSKLSELWNNGSVIKSWLLELIGEAFKENPELDNIKGYVEDSGETRWMVKSAVDMGVSLPVISQSLFKRFDSRQDDLFSNKVLAAMRNKFGGHAMVRSEEEIKYNKNAGAGIVKPAKADGNGNI